MRSKIIIGQAATGDKFYPRPDITKQFWNSIENGNNIIITAPRRVGKTSLMKHFKDEPNGNYKLLYVITESINNSNEFFRKIFKEIITLLSGFDKIKAQISKLIGSKQLTSLTRDGFQLESKDCDYFDEIVKAFRLLDFEDYKLIIEIDEFSQTVENIIEDENERNAIQFLGKNRELRHLENVRNKVQFVYAGSIGLENIVSKINAINTINDLYSLAVPQFSKTQANGLIDQLTNDVEWHISDEAITYIFDKIEWLIPYYIQIIIDEIDKIEQTEEQIVTSDIIDRAIDNALAQRVYFEHWIGRLRKAYKSNDFKFVKEVLNKTTENGILSSGEIFNIAVKHEIEETFQDLVSALKHDGYINNNDDPKIYRYNSPLLRIWWDRNVNF